jgi:hypothetical protein
VLRLLPGEETIFELKIVNHGDPSNISVDTSPHLIKAMRLKRANHFVKKEEVVPVLARMPDNAERVDGELLVTGEGGTSRVPISLIREGGDFEEESVNGEGDDEVEPPFTINEVYGELEGEDDEEDSEEDGPAESEAKSDSFIHDVGDNESYKPMPHGRDKSGHGEEGAYADQRERRDYGPYAGRQSSRSWSDLGEAGDFGKTDHGQDSSVEKETPYLSRDRIYSSDQEPTYPGPDSASDDSPEGASEDDEEPHRMLFGIEISAEKIVPIIILVMIIVLLALTFYTPAIPEFLGALTSSILIVTLIIYGAATLLKA